MHAFVDVERLVGVVTWEVAYVSSQPSIAFSTTSYGLSAIAEFLVLWCICRVIAIMQHSLFTQLHRMFYVIFCQPLTLNGYLSLLSQIITDLPVFRFVANMLRKWTDVWLYSVWE